MIGLIQSFSSRFDRRFGKLGLFQGLLDDFGGAAAAYSLRRLNSGYSGAIVNVRRSGDADGATNERDFTAEGVALELEDWVNGKLEDTLPADLPPNPQDITAFTTSGSGNSDLNGTFTLNAFGWQKPSGDGYIRYFKSGTQWFYREYDGEEGSNFSLSNDDVQYPWQITNWLDSPPTFDSFVGGNIDNTPAAAYSLRKVRNAYTGNAVQIRRTSDNVEVNVAFDSNGEVSTSSAISNVDESPDAGDTTATTLGEFLTEGGNQDATVVTWYDQSGNGYDATQLATGSQPKIAENGSLLADGGKPTLRFDGVDDYLETTNVSIKSLFARYNIGSGSYTLYGQPEDALEIFVNNSNISFDGFLTAEGRVAINGGNLSGYAENHTGIYATDAVGYFEYENLQSNFSRIGASRSPLDLFLDGTLSEIIVYTSDQSTNRFKIESNINNYYGIYTAAEDGFVETWYDQSGNDNHAVQLTLADQPQIVSAGSYLGELDFDGVDDFLECGNIGAYQSSDGSGVFCVLQKDTTSTSDVFSSTNPQYLMQIYQGSIVSTTLGFRIIGGKLDSFRRNAANTDYLGTRGDTHLVDTDLTLLSQVGGQSIDLFKDGAELSLQQDESGLSLSQASPSLNIGSQNGTTRFIDGGIKELIFYSSDQSANRAGIESNIADEYGITLP